MDYNVFANHYIEVLRWRILEGTLELCDDLASPADSARGVALGKVPLPVDAELVHDDQQ